KPSMAQPFNRRSPARCYLARRVRSRGLNLAPFTLRLVDRIFVLTSRPHRAVTASPEGPPGTIHFFSYFFLKRSIRPPVSGTRCFPVKNGCDADDISIPISG